MSKPAPPDERTPLRHFSASLPMLLLRARETDMIRFRSMLRGHGLTEQQWRVLRALQAGGRLVASQITDATYLLGPSLTRILRYLNAQRLVVIGQDPRDARRKLVELSRDGKRKIASIAPRSEEIYAGISEQYGWKNLERLQGLLEQLQALGSSARPSS